MDMDRAAMRGRLAEQKDRAAGLEMKIDGLCRTLRMGLNTALVPVVDLEVPLLAGQMDDLVAAWGELHAIRLSVARLEKELR